MFATIGWLDSIVLVAALVVTICVGLFARGRTNSIDAFLVGNRNLPWWAILGSIVATETSTATVLSLPATAFGPTGMKFLQIAFGYVIGRTIVVHLLLPLFFQGKLLSAYEVMNQRFGGHAQTFSSLLFLVTRNLGDGLRLFLAAIVLQKLAGWPFWSSAVVIGGITILYTYFGGMRSVVWNDCIQLVIYMIGGIVSVVVIAGATAGGWARFWEYAEAEGKLSLWQPWPTGEGADSFIHWLVTEPYSIWAALIGGAVLTLGTHGTDQMMVQRYLSARSQRDARRAIFWSAIVVLFQFALFLFIGVQLSCYYANQPEMTFHKADEVYAQFIVHSFPQNTGLVGLMLAAILAAAMSTLSSSLNSSSAALMNDFLLRRSSTQLSPNRILACSRWLCVGFGILQIVICLAATFLDKDSTVVSNALTIAGYSAGILLGLFSLGVLTRRVQQPHALFGAGCGLLILLTVQFLLPRTGIKVAWLWYAVIGAGATFGIGNAAAWLVPTQAKSNPVQESNS